MSSVFWAAGAQTDLAQSAQELLSQFNQQGIHSDWIEEWHAVGSQDSPTPIEALLKPGAPNLSWPAFASVDHLVLQALCRQLEQGQGELLAISQVGVNNLSGLVLAGPAAIGRHNLMPEAAFTPLPPQNTRSGLDDLFASIAALLSSSGIDPAQVTWLAAVEPLPRGEKPIHPLFPQAQWLPFSRQAGIGVVARANLLITRLIKKKNGCGLLLSLSGVGDACLITMVERV
jgi:hypothetical protein